MGTFGTLTLDLKEHLAEITFNRPEKRNAISPRLIEDLMAALNEADRSTARVVILTGAGKAFCSGMDLEALKLMAENSADSSVTREPANEGVMDIAVRVLKGETTENAAPHPESQSMKSALESSRATADMFRRIYEFPKPTIAAVNGPAIAGGCGIATLCDFTLAALEAKFGYSEVRIGFVPALVSVFLIRQIGEKRARDLLLTGRIVGAEEARELGLVTEVVPPEQLMDRARELAAQLIENSPASLAYTKRILQAFSEKRLGRELELAIEANARIRSTADFREGVTAFIEKRKPVW